MRKLGGYILGMVGLIIYIFLVTGLADALFPLHIALEITYYAVMGIGWIFPAMILIRWWYRPKDTEEKN
ncbi:DUF2842 domain-containing protein [Paremcibacter congregatus]|uniref:DUF2842 domain-containing protein n=1 Tax=Paremcibacter congregatus TaxID=2043170 RepID=A0A2G4YUB7_9PROT|nr:DUF2842 domain-containing protein [Paremcibacter congregatus]PHZ85840.1 hypothetical protein CRD36_03945 [Paremcibacter congregatus]QDE26803.1 DUF2842 domain-containing protein [Paremcibacter congregatus]|tara:strand:+ start:425 stop:631 length:207 start_codon:yes stop_codon:yes gene_type:complete